MGDGVSAFPLAWPAQRPRTREADRVPGRFTSKGDKGLSRAVTVAEARERVQHQLDQLRAQSPVLSTNIELRRDGLPRSGQGGSTDTGVALYFRLNAKPVVLACDRYTTVAANIAAIAAHLESTRAIERHGVGSLDEAFAGFVQLPPPGARTWRTVLGFGPAGLVTRDQVRTRRVELARHHHPDAGGSSARMAEINGAVEQALQELRDE